MSVMDYPKDCYSILEELLINSTQFISQTKKSSMLIVQDLEATSNVKLSTH